jgi:uncharacterized membrane protein required for colicin V production
MTFVELALIAVVCGFGIAGFASGLIQAIGSLIGVFVGTAVATRTYATVAGFALPLFGGNEVAASIVSFIVIFLVTGRLIGLIVHLLDKAYKFLAFFPGLKMLNRIGGFVLGLLEGAFIVGVVLNLLIRLPLSPETVQTIHDSQWLSNFLALGGWLLPLFPKALEEARDLIQ